LWDLRGNCQTIFRGHTGAVLSASFNPAGNCIVTASRDKTAKVWDLDGKCLVTLRGHINIVNSAEFNAVGDYIVTASADGTVRLWEDTRFTRAKAELKNEIFHFLVAQHGRCGANSPAHNLTQHVIQCIFDCYGLRPFDAIQ
jgi:WD40 repeat protein